MGCGSLSVADKTSAPVAEVESAEIRVARGAAALDAAYGPKWFRTENVSLGDFEERVSAHMDYSFLFQKGTIRESYQQFTERLQGTPFTKSELMLEFSHEIDGLRFGFYYDEPELTEAWLQEIRTRRYNRPSKRRVSAETGKTTRSRRAN